MNKTIEDIVSDIRSRNGCGVPIDGESSHCLAEDMLKLADQIETAWKREREAIIEDAADELLGKAKH